MNLSKLSLSALMEATASTIFLARDAIENGTASSEEINKSLYLAEQTIRFLTEKVEAAEGLTD